MKKGIIYAFLLILVVSGTTISCDDFLEGKSKSTFSDDVVFSNVSLTKDAVVGIYDVLLENNSYRNRLLVYLGYNNDVEYREGWSDGGKDSSPSEEIKISVYGADSDLGANYNDEGSANPWSRIYQGIERANLVIKGVETYGDPNPVSNPDMAHLLGEALGMRAFFYYDLVKWWGDVPARFEPLNDENLYVGKSDRDIIYNQIIDDLGRAATLMYGAGNSLYTSNTLRLNRESVRGLRARIALSAAGYSMRPVGKNDAEIKITASVERRKELYEIVRDECAAIINTGKFMLDPSFRNVFYEQCQGITTLDREAIFQLAFKYGVRGRSLYNFGIPRDAEASEPNNATFNSYVISCLFRIMPSYFYDFAGGDTRRDISVVPYAVRKNGNVMEQKFENGIIGFRPGKWRAEWYNGVIVSTDDGMPPMVLRYSDVLLMYAEADLYLNNGAPSSAASEYFNLVRRRAFGGSTSNDLPLTLDNLKDERRFEFAGENIRKFDLIRWGELKTALDRAKQDLKDLRESTGKYAGVPSVLWYRHHVATNLSPGERVMEIYGLNRGENDDKSISDPTGGWIKQEWTKEKASNQNFMRLADENVEWLYFNDPDKRQLLPIMHQIIVASQGSLSNDYGYQN